MALSSGMVIFVADAVDALSEGLSPRHRKLLSCEQEKQEVKESRALPVTNEGWEEVHNAQLFILLGDLRLFCGESPVGEIKPLVSHQGNSLIHTLFTDFSPFPLLLSPTYVCSLSSPLEKLSAHTSSHWVCFGDPKKNNIYPPTHPTMNPHRFPLLFWLWVGEGDSRKYRVD